MELFKKVMTVTVMLIVFCGFVAAGVLLVTSMVWLIIQLLGV